eukprot:jgi/Ulvmu1/6386/UM003_0014.1
MTISQDSCDVGLAQTDVGARDAEVCSASDSVETGKAETAPVTASVVHMSVSMRFRQLMPWIGMTPVVLMGWTTILDKPHVAFLCSTLTNLFTLVTNTSVLLFASTPMRWDHHAPTIVYALFHFSTSAMMLRRGPAIAKTKLYNALLVPAIFLQFIVAVRLMLGPLEHVPFGNRLVFVLVNSTAVWCWAFTSMTGAWAPDHPPQPFRSLVEPVADATVRALRLTDAITDMLIIRLMLGQAQEPCYWFGALGGCMKWTIMAAAAGCFAVADLGSGLFLAMSGSGIGRTHISKRMRRIFTIAHITSFSCELGILIVTLVKLFSEFRIPESSVTSEAKRNSIALTIVSFMITIITFSVTMVGMQRLTAAVARVTDFVQVRITKESHRTTRHSAPADAAAHGPFP